MTENPERVDELYLGWQSGPHEQASRVSTAHDRDFAEDPDSGWFEPGIGWIQPEPATHGAEPDYAEIKRSLDARRPGGLVGPQADLPAIVALARRWIGESQREPRQTDVWRSLEAVQLIPDAPMTVTATFRIAGERYGVSLPASFGDQLGTAEDGAAAVFYSLQEWVDSGDYQLAGPADADGLRWMSPPRTQDGPAVP